jgi:2-desacetyl-2-hydroxyethyl bacteriochlorophyllide A dehydrogenase
MDKTLNRLSLYFTGLKSVEVCRETVPFLQPGQVLVRTLFSAISAGTELLIYRRQASSQQPLDTSIRSLSGSFQFPLKYGYSIVGTVVSAGPEDNSVWIGKTVFAFHPHESLFAADVDDLIEIPDHISPLDAVFLPNMETAVNFVMDGQPVLGEKVMVFGQGIVGLLTTSVLSQFPLKTLITLDQFPLRRRISQQIGAQISLDPNLKESFSNIQSLLRDEYSTGADLVYEVSGNTEALNQAIDSTGFNGRIVIGSWYGSKPVNLRLDAGFHRSRIRLVSSQVSTIAPGFQGRWNKSRRFQTAWQMLGKIKPSQFISRSIPLSQAPEAYRILDENPDEVIQIVFSYPDSEENYV